MKQRIEKLKQLKRLIADSRQKICDALFADLGKPPFESRTVEILIVQEHISFICKNLKHWLKPEKVRTSWFNRPAACEIRHEALGQVLVFSPWNYPFQLALLPVIGAYAAGNRITLKPSEYAPATAALLDEMIKAVFSEEEVSVIQGDAETAKSLLNKKWDLIFFTGSGKTGQAVAKAAAGQLTPVILELGGKSPCIVNRDADLKTSARRIAWGKFLNAGQTCVAPDYLLVHKEVKEKLIAELHEAIRAFFGENPLTSPDYARIVNAAHFDRLLRLAGDTQTVSDRAKLKIAPLILPDAAPDSPVMEEEIFGPLLPVLSFETLEEAIAFIRSEPEPLALYYFGHNRKEQEQVLNNTRSGTVAVNDCVAQISNETLPFGGTGASGMGKYHGKESVLTFTHARSIMRKNFFPEISFRYPPYTDWKQKLLHLIMRLR